MPELSDDTKAALLLGAHLLSSGDRSYQAVPLLKPKEFSLVERKLNDTSRSFADLFADDVRDAVGQETGLSPERLDALFDRGSELGLALEKWTSRGIWIVTRADDIYPHRLRERLRDRAPIALFGAGSVELLSKGGLAVVGSRNADDEALEFARAIGRECARESVQVVSGAARGVDEEAMAACFDEGGTTLGIVGDSLEKRLLSRKYREGIEQERLTLVSQFHPAAPFSAGTAMARNATVYGLSDSALVVSSGVEEGGTWNGAVENMKAQWVPLYVRDSDELGNRELLRRGAHRWPTNAADIKAFLSDTRVRPDSDAASGAIADGSIHGAALPELNDVFAIVEATLLTALSTPRTAQEFAEVMHLEKSQANAWLSRLVAEGKAEKAKRKGRIRFRAVDRLPETLPLFSAPSP